MSPLEVLKAARKLIENGWTQGVLARDANGNAVGVYDQAGCQFCTMGAVWRVCGEFLETAAAYGARDELSAALSRETRSQGIPSFNDYPGRTQREVLELFDKAIERAEVSK